MYAEFLKMCCQGEKELNDQYNRDMYMHTDTIQCQYSRLKCPQVINQPQECTGTKNNTPFCDRPIENERIPHGRENNGNLQKMFLFSTKNTIVSSCGIVGWSDDMSIRANDVKENPSHVWNRCRS